MTRLDAHLPTPYYHLPCPIYWFCHGWALTVRLAVFLRCGGPYHGSYRMGDTTTNAFNHSPAGFTH